MQEGLGDEHVYTHGLDESMFDYILAFQVKIYTAACAWFSHSAIDCGLMRIVENLCT